MEIALAILASNEWKTEFSITGNKYTNLDIELICFFPIDGASGQ